MPIRFAATIKIISPDEYSSRFYGCAANRAPYGKEERILYPWTPKESLIRKWRGETAGLMDCIGGGVTNGSQVSMFHLSAIERSKHFGQPVSPKVIAAHIQNDIIGSFAAEPIDRQQALITGGADFELDDPAQTLHSQPLFNTIRQIFDSSRLKDATSILWGRRNLDVFGNTNVIYEGDNDTWFICIEQPDKTDYVKTLAELQKTLSVLLIGDKDTLQLPRRKPIKGPVNLHA